MKRLLCIVSSMDRGGAETFLMKVYRNLDRNKYQMDFCVSKEKKGFYDDEIKSMGGKIYFIPPKSKNPFKTFLQIKKIVKENNYQYVLRTSQQSLATLDLLAAKFGGAKTLIYRSSNAGLTGGVKKRIINGMFMFLPRMIPNVKVAPSKKAAEFVFGKKAVAKGKVHILNNGLDYDLFAYNEKIRKQIRKELKLDDKIIIGHVGRFNEQKNHEFLIKIFKEIHEENQNTVLLLIGEGELEDKIKKQVKNLGLSTSVKFLGPVAEVSIYLMAMDLFLFPSFFEGMPNVIIEAQATGLKCLLSSEITEEAKITDLLTYIDLDSGVENWVNIALQSFDYERKNYEKEFRVNKYTIEDVLNLFISIVYDGGISEKEKKN